MIVGISGLANAGKDTVADFLVIGRRFVKVSLADPMKRFCAEMFEWDDDRLWGPSALRNAIDDRYKRPDGEYLSARHALQQLGTEWGRSCYENMWIDYGIRTAQAILSGIDYNAQFGLDWDDDSNDCGGVVIPDVRFKNEMAAIRKAGGEVWRIVRPGEEGLTGAAAKHASENDIQEGDCDRIILNNRSLEALQRTVLQVRL
jgi:hypothetical protein